MNARTTTLMIVLALVLAACVAPMPAPPPRVELPKVEQTLPIQNVPAQNQNTSPVVQVSVPTDKLAKTMLEARQQLVDKLMVGLPPQARPYVETYAAIKVVEVAKLVTTPTQSNYLEMRRSVLGMPAETRAAVERYLNVITNAEKINMIEHNAVGVPPEVQSAMQQYIETLETP